MNLLGRTIKVIKSKGIGFALKKAFRKLFLKTNVQPPAPESKTMADISIEGEKYNILVSQFREKIKTIKYDGLSDFYWYHTIDLGDGLITPGDYDYRNCIENFNFPHDMSGMEVLDIGSATGFFAFEFEKRGAKVTSVELPSILDWDIINGDEKVVLQNLMKHHNAKNADEVYYRHLFGPFEFCQRMLKSNITRVYSSIYELQKSSIANKKFDLVFLGDILLHLFSPFKALNTVASFCKDKLIIATDLYSLTETDADLRFMGNIYKADGDQRTWWQFNKAAIKDMVQRVGFSKVEINGEYSGVARRDFFRFNRFVFHITK